MQPLDLFLSYLRHYARKDLEGISGMLSPDVILRDWNLSVSGKEAAVAETAKNFQDAFSIEIEILTTYVSEQGAAGELRITVNDTIHLFVVDVLTFNKEGLITSIHAYKGLG